MDTVELTRILSSDPYAKKLFLGVRASNHLPSELSRAPACLVANTDPSWRSGSHWLAIYCDENGMLEFFDSYGQDPKKYDLIYDFLSRNAVSWKMNRRQLQGSLSSTCGQFCLYFLLWRCRGVGFEKILRSFDSSVDTNDVLVTTFVNSLSHTITKMYDIDYVVNQCCKSFVPLSSTF